MSDFLNLVIFGDFEFLVKNISAWFCESFSVEFRQLSFFVGLSDTKNDTTMYDEKKYR